MGGGENDDPEATGEKWHVKNSTPQQKTGGRGGGGGGAEKHDVRQDSDKVEKYLVLSSVTGEPNF